MKLKTVLLLQAIYYLFTGLWPVVDIVSFMNITGQKTDIWLVKMVGLLTISIAIALLSSLRSHDVKSIRLLAICAAMSYSFIDIYYAMAGIIRKVYLIDAAAECIIIIFLFLCKRTSGTKGTNDF
jgi:hypothetical protein